MARGLLLVKNRRLLSKGHARCLDRREFGLFSFVVLATLCFEWLLGRHFNINIIVLATYALYLWVLFVRDKKFVLEFFWVVTMATLNIVGAFCCDEGLFLVELEYSSWYANAVAPLVFLYVLFFMTIEFYRLSREKFASPGDSENAGSRISQLILLVGVVMAVYLFLQVVRNPYFVAGTLRLDYASQYMSSFSVSLRTYLPMFIPIAVMEFKGGRRFLPIVFFAAVAAFYFLEGDKFGVYFFAAYIVALTLLPSISEKTIDRVILCLFVFFWLLIGIVYVQRMLLFDNSFSEFVEAISQRLAQQGEVWWSVYRQMSGGILFPGDPSSEIGAILNPESQSLYDFGQWKMMNVACGYSEYSAYRIAAGNPFTATTTASLFYYFGFPGTVVFYAVFGYLYAAVIRNASLSFSGQRILESIIYVKLISILGNILFASDITYLLSIQGAVYLLALAALTINREIKQERKQKSGLRIRRFTARETIGR